jgi:hypothetical protein
VRSKASLWVSVSTHSVRLRLLSATFGTDAGLTESLLAIDFSSWKLEDPRWTAGNTSTLSRGSLAR